MVTCSENTGHTQTAHKVAHKGITIEVGNHFINLYKSCLATLMTYKKGKITRNRCSFNKATQAVHNRTRTLQKQKWQTNYNSFEERTSIPCLWPTFQGMPDKANVMYVTDKFLLRLRCTKEELMEDSPTQSFVRTRQKNSHLSTKIHSTAPRG